MKIFLKVNFFCILFSLPVLNQAICAQGERLEQITLFGYRLKSPVEIEVTTDKSNLYFIVRNKSLFPYEFEISFNECSNLSPIIFDKKTTLFPGPNKLFTFRILDPEQPPGLSYKTKYYLSSTSTTDRYSPYLIPVGQNKTVSYISVQSGNLKTFLLNQFEMNPGDTVFTARKGRVTALPDLVTDVDRLLQNSLEIRHEDGTVGVYIGIDSQSMFVRLGQIVYPGQPLGRISTSKVLTFQVYEILNEGKVRSTDILFAGDKNQLLNAMNIQGIKVSYSPEIIKKEMTKKEIGKYGKKSLY